MGNLKQNGMVLLFLLSVPVFFSSGGSFQPDLSRYSVLLCGKISNEILNDVDRYNQRDRNSDTVNFIILISNDDPNSISDTRVVSDGEIFFKGNDMIKFDTSFIMTIDKGKHTDTVMFMSKENKVVGGYFYKNESSVNENNDVYISKTGAVYHLNIAKENDESCSNKFR
ncbi:hypothetical protein OH773_19720 [Buttiauxella sp. WJP83]|uniref:hypothetical protein n=1 Tax=Buttiauxella sp. WJP83 TaxID=2986951 RepID=UPI0022DD1059|nr:hypothetical protein [Buttiauxella sp. WJP83]WBM70338.1 hypothetical protein OH773_19720 [Buttiauxella sp. WJP83]